MGMTSVDMDDPNMEETKKTGHWGRIGINDFVQEFFRRGAELKPESMGYVIAEYQEKKLKETFYDKNRYSEPFRLGVASAFGLFFSYLQETYPDQDIEQEDVLIWFLNSIHGTFSKESVYDDATYANEKYIHISTDVYKHALDQFEKAVGDKRKSMFFYMKCDGKKGRFVTDEEKEVVNQYKEARQNRDHNKRVVQPRSSPHEEKKRDADERETKRFDPLYIQGEQKLLVEKTENNEKNRNRRRKRLARKGKGDKQGTLP
eukprot:2119718-Rhodomonas_salina.1